MGHRKNRSRRTEPAPAEVSAPEEVFSSSAPAVEDEPAGLEEMLSKMPKAVVGEGITVKGTIRGKSVMHIMGRVEGDVILDGAVTVEPQGIVEGTVKADVIHVAGSVRGDLAAGSYVKLDASGVVDGDIQTAAITIEDGAWFNGQTTMVRPPRP